MTKKIDDLLKGEAGLPDLPVTSTVVSVLRKFPLCLETTEAHLHISNILTNAKAIINL